MWGFPVYSQRVPGRVTTLVETDVVLNDPGMASVLFSLKVEPIKHTGYVHPEYPE
jgi:NhaP-type Na+/H+ or K+/H+ antiporter